MKYFFILLTLYSCSTFNFSNSEICNTDWEIQGEIDGAKGVGLEQYLNYQKECTGEKEPNKKHYLKGRKRGLKRYCTKENGYQLGREGKMYNNVCKSSGLRNMQKGFLEGSKVYCSFENGIVQGKKGGEYQSNCPAKYESDFRRGFLMGKENFDLDAKIDEVNSKRNELNRTRENYYQRIQDQKLRCEWNSDCPANFQCVRQVCQRSKQ